MIKDIIYNYVNNLDLDKEEKINLRIQLLYDFFQDDYFKGIYKNLSILTINKYPSILNEKIQKIEGENSGGFENFLINYNFKFDLSFREEIYNAEKKSKHIYLNENDFYQLNKIQYIIKKSSNKDNFEELFWTEFKKNKDLLIPYIKFYGTNSLNKLLSYLSADKKSELENYYKESQEIYIRNYHKNEDYENFELIKNEVVEKINQFKIKRISNFYNKDENYSNHLEKIKQILTNKKNPELFIFQTYSEDNEIYLKNIKLMDQKEDFKLYDNQLNLFYNNSKNSIYRGLSYGKESSYNAGSLYSKLYIGFHNGLELVGILQATSKKNMLTITSVCVAENYRGQQLVQSMYDNLYQIAEKENKVVITGEYSDTGVKKLPYLRKKMKEKYPNVLHINCGYDKGYKEQKNNKDFLIKHINESLSHLLNDKNVIFDIKKLRNKYDSMLIEIENSEILLSEKYYLGKYFKNIQSNKEENKESRKDFLNRISNLEPYVTLQIEGTEEDFNLFNEKKLNELFIKIKYNKDYESFFIENKIKEISNSVLPKIELDYYELEDYDQVVFNVTLNVNELYDAYKNEYKTNYVEVYRVEGNDGNGLYQQNIKIENNKNRPSPYQDGDISLIFNGSMTDNNPYQKEYIFGFKDLNQLKEWIKDIDMSNLIIKKYKIPENYVIEGEKQIIFKKEESEFIENIDINNLNKKVKLKIK